MRGGAGALAKWEGSDPFAEFRSASFEELRDRGKQRDEKKEAGIKVELGDEVGEEQKLAIQREEEQAEQLLLQGREAVQARKFEGATYKATNIEIRNEWQATLARASNSRTVVIDGHPVLKETIVSSHLFSSRNRTDTRAVQNNGSWEAVKTITSSHTKPAPTKKRRQKFEHEDVSIDSTPTRPSLLMRSVVHSSVSSAKMEAKCTSAPRALVLVTALAVE